MRLSNAALLSLLVSSAASAQPPPQARGGYEARAALLSDGSAAWLVARWGATAADFSTSLFVEGHAPIPIAERRFATCTLAVGHDVLLVATLGDDGRAPFEIRFGRGVGAGFTLGDPVRVPHPPSSPSTPLGVVATETPEGFAVFFQETEIADPTAAHTYLVRLRVDGTPYAAPSEIPVPWGAGDALWNGQGFHLALFYPGDARGVRLSMVSLTRDGRPEQHPDWSSAAGMVRDVHLVRDGERILALYRGGERVLESDVTAIRAWGTEPPRARDRGRLASDELIATRGTAEHRVITLTSN